MPQERLEAEIARLSARIKELDQDLAREDVYRDAKRCQNVLTERDQPQAELERHEEEWLSRSE